MRTARSNPPAPPRLLLGVSLLFWGAVTEHPVVGLLCAFAVEARAWIDWRWDFGARGFVRAWALSVLMGFLTLVAFWLQGESFVRLFSLLIWIPVFLLPIMLAQQYATVPSLPLNTFSFIARRKMQMDREAGRAVDPVLIHFGYPYFCLVIVAASLGRASELVFFIGLGVLAGLGLFFGSKVARLRPLSWALALFLMAIFGGGTAFGLRVIFDALSGLEIGGGGNGLSDRIRTGIGDVGEIKLSYRIMWRVNDPERGARLFRQAVYNRYGSGHWTHRPMRGSRPSDDYDDMVSRVSSKNGEQFAFEREEFDLDPVARKHLTLRGAVQTITPLPLPDSTQRLDRVQAIQGHILYNSLGTVRIENPDHPVADLDVYYGGPGLYERPPDLEWDLQIPHGLNDRGRETEEKEGIARVCRAWDLYERPAKEVMSRISEKFIRDFKYTLHRPGVKHTGPTYKNAISVFLENDLSGRQGHCEYFATAAVLLLREAGIPARYCVGFSAQEMDEGTGDWILRGRHGHAWCRVYVGGRQTTETVTISPGVIEERIVWTGGQWEDFDPTPPGWFEIDGSVVPWDRRLIDWWQRLREDFLIWRTTKGNSLVVNLVMGVLAVGLVLFVTWRLIQSRTHTRRRRRGGAGSRGGGDAAIVTPLHDLSRSAEHWLGPRGEGEAFTKWISGLGALVPATESNLHRAVNYHWKARFDPIGLDPGEESEFKRLCTDLKNRLKEVRRAER